MPILTTPDGCDLFFSDWGERGGRPVVLVHAWGLSSDMWDHQLPDLVEAGRRGVVYDRRGHGRSDRPGGGYDLDTLADDLAAVLDHLDLTNVVLVGHSMGACEVVRYITRHGSTRVTGLVLSAPTLPALLRTEDNPNGVDASDWAAQWAAMRNDIGKWIAEGWTNEDYFGPAMPMSEDLWTLTRHQIESTPLVVLLACQKGFVEADFRAELGGLDLPTLVIQGDADTSAPLELTGRPTAAIVRDSRLVVIEGAGHGLYASAAALYNRELLDFMATGPTKPYGMYREPQVAGR
jgi:non-heme chloroperoxidase